MGRVHKKRCCLLVLLTFTVFLLTILTMKANILTPTMMLPYNPLLTADEYKAVIYHTDEIAKLVDDAHHNARLSQDPNVITTGEHPPEDLNTASRNTVDDEQSISELFKGDKTLTEISDTEYTTELSNIQFPVDEDKNKTVGFDGDRRSEEVNDTLHFTGLPNSLYRFDEGMNKTMDLGYANDNDGGVNGRSQLEDNDGWEIINNENKLREEIDSIHERNYKVKDGDKCIESVPDCVIVGVGKCGTRELIDFMSIHPNIVSRTGHYQIRSDLFTGPDAKSNIATRMPCKYRDQKSVFKADAFLTQTTKPSQLYQLNPNMKIIAILREPVSRLISHLSFKPKRNGGKAILSGTNVLNDWFEQNIYKLSFTRNQKVLMSKYDKGLERYLQTFKRDNVLVIESNEFKADPTGVIRRVEDFLGIQNFVSSEHFALNPQNKFYCIRKTREVSKSMVCYESNRGRNKTIIADKHLEALRDHFRPHNENLFRLMGKRYDW